MGRGRRTPERTPCQRSRSVGLGTRAALPPWVSLAPQPHRPRERLLAHGVQALADSDLLALVLGSGVRGRSAEALSAQLLSHMGGIGMLSRARVAELRAVAGIGSARAARVVAAFELGDRARRSERDSSPVVRGPQDVHESVRSRLIWLEQEVFLVLALDARNHVLDEIEVARGTLAGVEVHPREVFRPLIRRAAYSCVVVHNHPSGDPTPSQEDVDLTLRLAEAGAILGIAVLDHVVVARSGFVSLSDVLGGEGLHRDPGAEQ